MLLFEPSSSVGMQMIFYRKTSAEIILGIVARMPRVSPMFSRPIILALCFSSIQPVLGVLALQNFQADKHHRFANDSAFIGSGYEWSGVARAGQWATMISSTYFVSAAHSFPGTGTPLIFHVDNNPAGATITRTVLSTTIVAGTDIMIGRLDATPGPTIALYSVASNTTSGALFSSSPYSDREAFMVGVNNTGSGTTQFRVGRNVLDGFYDLVTVGSTTSDGITFDDDRGTPESLGDDETYLQGGDSGAPMFVTMGGDLVLVGTNWFISSGESPNFSGTTFLPNHIDEINAILTIGGESLTLVAIPEPSALPILSLIGASVFIMRRR